MPPIHQVNLNWGACLFTLAGCKCIKTFEITFSTRFFGVSVKVCLKIDFQTCELTVISQNMPNNPFSFSMFLYFVNIFSFGLLIILFYTFKNAPGLSHSPRSPRYLTPASTIICPSSPSTTLNLSSGLGAGPSMLSPSGVKPLP